MKLNQAFDSLPGGTGAGGLDRVRGCLQVCWQFHIKLCFSRPLHISGGEAQADRAHAEREEDPSGCQLSFSGAVRVLIQGKRRVYKSVFSMQ